ncbi:MAG: hypothetical protein ABSG18_23835 [Steroidobacteraceae bacterium]|jgi:hypothetical protein
MTVVGGAAKNLCTEMGLGIDRHDEVRKLNSGVGAIQFAAHALQLGGRALCRESPHLDLGAIKLEIPTLHGLTHAFEAVFNLLDQLLEHRLDGVIVARRSDRRAPGVEHLGARLE